MALSLSELSDREEIRQVIYKHFRAADRLDQALEMEACWDDAVFEGGPVDQLMSEAVPIIYGEMLPKYFDVTNHYMANFLIDVRGDEAFTETYALAYHIVPADEHAIMAVLGPKKFAEMNNDASRRYEFIMGMRYAMRLEKRGGVWKIATIRIVNDWSSAKPYSGVEEEGVYSFLKLRGTRDRTDQSYPWNP
ncbi:nuclear transport factor 2 family protein [Sphingobium subterraneum]|uniref:SnoaL-like domain-containing protein n=1 Tax=Sphingobium subterraneum TaxID=627688 RepID=A0A841J3J5_9SPHN|nr:nuclear transport factor 2 family protein [Sphingobium subterraneum]MBB6125354.1 hypothetical protein [Sphingobium subterraneum]